MQRPTGPRKTVNLSESIHQQLSMYAIAAGAAGVSLLALTEPSEAKIVYTAAHHVIARNSRFTLDLNHDGKTDFIIGNSVRTATSGSAESIFVSGHSGNGVEGTAGSPRFLAAALKRGTPIPNRRRFTQTKARMAYFCGGFITSCPQVSTFFFSGNWVSASKRYLGLKFKIEGKTRYGWARLSIQWTGESFSATLTGYAYETVPGKKIIAGQTKGADDLQETPDAALTTPTTKNATLGVLALGAQGVIWRRKESALDSQGSRLAHS